MTHAEGKLDIDEMLELMTPAQFDGWWEFYKLKPWGNDWHRSSRTTAAVLNQIRMAIPREKNSGKIEMVDDDVFVPKWKRKNAVDKDIAAQCAAADSIEGFGF